MSPQPINSIHPRHFCYRYPLNIETLAQSGTDNLCVRLSMGYCFFFFGSRAVFISPVCVGETWCCLRPSWLELISKTDDGLVRVGRQADGRTKLFTHDLCLLCNRSQDPLIRSPTPGWLFSLTGICAPRTGRFAYLFFFSRDFTVYLNYIIYTGVGNTTV